jgi:trimeric autotransporter adhesin
MVSPSPSYGVTISNVKVNGGGDTVTVDPGAALKVTLSYSIVDTACPGCIDQIQVGFSSQKPFTCVYNGVPGASGKSGTASFTTAAPSTRGTYYLAFDRSQAYSCPTDWWNGVPPAQRYFAQINVEPALTSISISPSEYTINEAWHQFTAVGTYSDGSTKDVTTSATWSSADPSIATAYNTAPPNIGVVKGMSNGKTTISAKVGNVTGTTSVTVTIGVYSISPANTTVALGTNKQLKFLYTLGGNSTDHTTHSGTEWTSSDTAIAAVSSTGVVSPVAKGTATIRASIAGNAASATVGVTNPSSPVLSIAAINPIDKGGTGQLTARYIDTNGVTQDVTASAMWATANKAVASVTNGTVSGLSNGTTTITATYGGRSASVSVDVVTRILSGWFISPCNPSINLGSRRALSYYHLSPEGSIWDVTGNSDLHWSSSNPGVATVSGGNVSGVALGQATITAEFAGNRNTVVVTVVSSGANSWNLAQCNPTIPVGSVRQLTFKSPDNSWDVTGSANWSSSNSAIVTVDRGTIKGVSAGQATITAEYAGNRISTTVTVK